MKLKEFLEEMGVYESYGEFNREQLRIRINSQTTLNRLGEPSTEFNTGNIGRRTIFHEYLHPFVEILEDSNKKLYNEIYNKALEQNKKENFFTDQGAYSKKQQQEELVVRYLDTLSKNDRVPGILKSFLNFISEILFKNKKNNRATLEQLSTETSVEELYDVFKNYGNLKQDVAPIISKDNLKKEIEFAEKLLKIAKEENLPQENINAYQNDLDILRNINNKPRGRETKNNKLNLQDEIQDKRRTVIRSENEADRTRKGGSIDIKGKSRYDVGRSDRVVRDDTVVQTISLSQKEAQDLEKRLGDKAVLDTEFYETNDAELFHKSITDSTKNNKYAASVFVYPVSEYENSRLFLTADGKAGLAITADGDIISVFSSGKGKGRVPQLIVTAIKEGATSLDHYDTVLTKYYADFGFVPAAKVKWNNEFAPDGWSKETFKAFNNGEPDVVAMVYDGGNRQTITERVGTFESVKPKLEKAPYVTEWDDAKALQESAKPSRGREQQEQEIFDYVTAAREDNFRDEVTKDFLVRIKKYPAKLVNRMMEVDVDLFKTLPKTFGSLTGGFKSGLRLYKRTKAFEQKLIKANKRKKVKLTEQQIADQTIEFLKKTT